MDRTGRCRPARWFRLAAGLLLVCAPPGCSLPTSPTLATVPAEWRGRHPFGPEGNAARARGEWGLAYHTSRTEEWAAFGREHIRDGDIFFRRGRSYMLPTRLGCYVLAAVNDGRFTHVGIARWENGQLWIYDVESQGTRKVPFELWALDVVGNDFAIKRLRPEYRAGIPQALAYCEAAYQRKVPFDFSFDPGDERLYCSELVAKAFRSAGVALMEPIPIRRMPGYKRFRYLSYPAKWCMGICVDAPVFAPGNEYYGLFGSPCLEPVFEGPEEQDPPQRNPPTPDDGSSEETKVEANSMED